MCHDSILLKNSVGADARNLHRQLFLFALGGAFLLGWALLLRRLRSRAVAARSGCFAGSFGRAFGWGSFFLFRRQSRSAKRLTVKSNLGNTDSRERLAMSVHLLVLLLALQVEDQNLVFAAFFHHRASYRRACAGANLAFLAGNGQNIFKFNCFAFSDAQFFHFYNVAGSDTILLPPGPNDRVHNSLQRLCLGKRLSINLRFAECFLVCSSLAHTAGTDYSGKPNNFNVISRLRSTSWRLPTRKTSYLQSSYLPVKIHAPEEIGRHAEPDH